PTIFPVVWANAKLAQRAAVDSRIDTRQFMNTLQARVFPIEISPSRPFLTFPSPLSAAGELSSRARIILHSTVVLANLICACSATRGSRFTIKGTQRSLARLKVRGKEL